MKVLMLHNRYRQLGGEDAVVRAEVDVLRDHGVDVIQANFHNEVPGRRWGEAARLGIASAWSARSHSEVEDLCRNHRPDVAHVHNFWFKLTPAVHAACQALSIPTIQTLHNFRLLCANAMFLRDGQVCEDCMGKVPWRGITRRCYRSSYLSSAAVARMIFVNRCLGTWHEKVDAFIMMTEHARSLFSGGGLPPEKLFLNPNFTSDPGEPSSLPSDSDTILYVGRLSPERNLAGLLSSWAQGNLGRYGRLLFIGDGPDREALERHAHSLKLSSPTVTFTGWKSHEEVLHLISRARALVLPSLCYEGGGCPMAVIEAYACGRPAIVSDLGGLREIVLHEKTGLKVSVGDTIALTDALRRVLTDDALADRTGREARAEYLNKYTPEHHYQKLMNIYRFAMNQSHAVQSAAAD